MGRQSRPRRYRDGSRSNQPMALDSKPSKSEDEGSSSDSAGKDEIIDMLLEG